MPNVLLLFEHTSLNGGERSILVLLDQLQRAGMHFHAVAQPSGPLATALAAAGVEIIRAPLVDARGDKRFRGQVRGDLAGIIRRTKPDLLHANSLAMSRLVGPVARELGVPCVGHLRDILKLNAAAIADLNCHDRMLAVSMATRDYHVAQGLQARRVHVAYNGVDVHHFCPRQPTGWLHDQLSLASDTFLIGGVGQIILRKGWDVWLEAATTVVAKNPRAHFVLVGQRHSEKQETRELQQRLLEAGQQGTLSGHLHWLGSRDDMHLLLPELVVLAHAARQEPLGRVLLEAAACGVPVVATDVGGTREIFGERSAAADLVPVDDADRLAAGILSILANRDIAAGRATEARRRVGALFDHRHAARNLLGHYEAVLS